MTLADQLGALLGFALTVMVFSYVVGDNPFFRFAVYLFIGVTAGMATIMAINSVLLPHLVVPLVSGSMQDRLFAVVPLFLGGLLLTKVSPRLSNWGSLSMAYLIGVGVAAAIGGAVTGTIFPQILAAINLFDLQATQNIEPGVGINLLNAIVMVTGTTASLAYFYFGILTRPSQPSRPQAWMASLGQVGKVFIAIAFGFLFAGVLSAVLVAMIERVNFMVNFIQNSLLSWIS